MISTLFPVLAGLQGRLTDLTYNSHLQLHNMNQIAGALKGSTGMFQSCTIGWPYADVRNFFGRFMLVLRFVNI